MLEEIDNIIAEYLGGSLTAIAVERLVERLRGDYRNGKRRQRATGASQERTDRG